MPSFLERYCNGDQEQVWDELVRLGDQVRNELVVVDALAVAHETMRRAKENIERLVPRLHDIGYQFAYQSDPGKRIKFWWGDSFPIYEPPLLDVGRRLDELDRKLGPMPLSLRAWYERVGTVNLIGRHKDWPETEVADPLVVCPFADIARIIEHECQDWRRFESEKGKKDVLPFRWEIAPDDLHKANISGGAPYGVEYPSAHADVRLWFEWHNTTFVNYLRVCFHWGGFPGFERVAESKRPSKHLAFLTGGLLPL